MLYEFIIEKIHEIMQTPDIIRNMSVIGHEDHGKSTIIDSLIAKAWINDSPIAKVPRYFDYHSHCRETDISISIKSKDFLLYYNFYDGISRFYTTYLINLIDTSGNFGYYNEVTATLRVTDGALVVVDCVEGMCVQTETVLRQALHEKIKLVLMINKVDRNLLEFQLDPEIMYQSFCRTIKEVNVIISTYDDGTMEDIKIDPTKGNCAFGSGIMGWAFTLKRFAAIYAKKFGIDEAKMMELLWGENYFDAEVNTWKKNPVSESGKPLERSFCVFCIEPIQRVTKAVMEGNTEELNNICTAFNIRLKPKDRELQEKKLLTKVMEKWLNIGDTLLEMIIIHLPSPKVSQKYRTDYLYEGPLNDECAEAMRNCDPKGPLMIYVSKMVPTTDCLSKFYAVGRVFSGTVSSGQRVRIMGGNYIPGRKEDLYIRGIRTVMMQGEAANPISKVPCGNMIGLVGIGHLLLKNCTVTTSEVAHKIKVMKQSKSPAVKVAVRPKNNADLPKLRDGLEILSISDFLVKCGFEDCGECMISGSDEVHIEACIQNLIHEFARIEIIQSDPIAIYKETVLSTSSRVCMTTSPNKHNRLYATAEPFPKGLTEAIEDNVIFYKSKYKPEAVAKTLQDDYGWDPNDAKKIWFFNPKDTGVNMLVDQTNSVQYANEVKDSIGAGFGWATSQGVLCEEQMRGVRFNVIDIILHADAIHRGGGQIIPTARRAFLAAYLTADPTLQEPILLVEIQCPSEVIGGVYQCLNSRRGIVNYEEPISGIPLTLIKAYLPVAESFGFTSHLKSMTSGKAFSNCVLDHWEILSGSPFDVSSKCFEVTMGIRTRKGLTGEIPSLDKFLDKI